MTEVFHPTLIEIGGTSVWMQEVHGLGGHHPLFDPAGAALYFSDGWGNRPVPALRFRRLDVTTGAETAKWPCGSAVRCLVALDGGDMLVATDQRLVRLAALTLTERARWNRSVRHATTMAVQRGVAVAGNPVMPTIGLVDLVTGAVRRKRLDPSLRTSGPVTAIRCLLGGHQAGLRQLIRRQGQSESSSRHHQRSQRLWLRTGWACGWLRAFGANALTASAHGGPAVP
jgi:hypothetical protein